MKNETFINKMAKNWGLKLIALAIAFLIWLLVTNTNNPTKSQLFTGIPINLVNQDSVADIGKVVDLEGSGTVNLKVTERRRVLERLSRSDFYVEADLENLTEMNTVPLTVTCTNSAVTWDEIEISPSSLKVTLEDKVEQAFVVSVSPQGTTAGGFEVGTTEVAQGRSIYIAGPESVIKIINQVVATVNVGGLNEDTTLSSVLRVYDKNGSELTESQLNSLEFKDSTGAVINDRTVDVKVDLWQVRSDIPLVVDTVGTPADGYQVTGVDTVPATVNLAGTDEALKALNGVLKVSDPISVEGASENVSQEIDLSVTMAELAGLKLASDTDTLVMAEVKIEKAGDETISIPLSSVQLQNRPEDMTLVVTPADKISITVHALTGSAEPLTAEDVTLSVDLSPCAEEGTYELPVDVVLPDGYELASDVTIIVNSQKQAEATEMTETE